MLVFKTEELRTMDDENKTLVPDLNLHVDRAWCFVAMQEVIFLTVLEREAIIPLDSFGRT